MDYRETIVQAVLGYIKSDCKNAGRHFLRPRHIEWRVWKRRGVEPMERKPDIDDLIFGDERPISQR